MQLDNHEHSLLVKVDAKIELGELGKPDFFHEKMKRKIGHEKLLRTSQFNSHAEGTR